MASLLHTFPGRSYLNLVVWCGACSFLFPQSSDSQALLFRKPVHFPKVRGVQTREWQFFIWPRKDIIENTAVCSHPHCIQERTF